MIIKQEKGPRLFKLQNTSNEHSVFLEASVLGCYFFYRPEKGGKYSYMGIESAHTAGMQSRIPAKAVKSYTHISASCSKHQASNEPKQGK